MGSVQDFGGKWRDSGSGISSPVMMPGTKPGSSDEPDLDPPGPGVPPPSGPGKYPGPSQPTDPDEEEEEVGDEEGGEHEAAGDPED
jgi:hypothetical protein